MCRCNRTPDVHLNQTVRGLPQSATIAINEHSAALEAEGREVFRYGLGQSPFPVPEQVVDRLRTNAHQKDYLPVKGLPALRESIARHHERTFGIRCSPEQVLIGPGSKELMFLLQLVYYGELTVPTPCWVSYAPQARIIGRQVQLLPTRAEDGWKLTPEILDAHCRIDPTRPRIIIVNYPSNPTGGTFDSGELRALADVAREYRAVVLSDEIYARLNYDGTHESIVPHYPEGSIFSGGLSKWCGAGGWRLGVFVVPESMRWLLDAMAAVASETFTSTSAPIQYAAIAAFDGGPEIDRYLVRSRRVLEAIATRLVTMLRAADIAVETPSGGFYLFPDFASHRARLALRGVRSSADLCRKLLDDVGVALLPGSDFGRAPDELTARLAFVNFNGAAALEAAEGHDDGELPADFVDRYCPKTVEGVARLCAWVQRATDTVAQAG